MNLTLLAVYQPAAYGLLLLGLLLLAISLLGAWVDWRHARSSARRLR